MTKLLVARLGRSSTPSPSADVATTGNRGGVIGPIRRRTIDTVLITAGVVVAVDLAVAGGLLTWGNNFAEDYVGDELTSQNIFFPDQASLEEDGRDDLVKYTDEQVTTGDEAEAYASFINGHVESTADGLTYAELSGPLGEAGTPWPRPRRPASPRRRSPTCRPTSTRSAGPGTPCSRARR